jgi:anti-sigma factor RsiW
MACEHAAGLVTALAEGALGPLGRWRARRRVARCGGCAALYDRLVAERVALRTALTRHRASPALAARIGAAIAGETPPPHRRRVTRSRVGPFAATAMAGALAGGLLVAVLPRGGGDGDASLIDAHVRAMMDSHMIDVPTSDRHTVKPWLSARVDVSPPVPDLTADGFVLLGGRTDVAEGHRAAVAVYRRDKHIIDLFAWADPRPDSAVDTRTIRGFNVISWRRNGIAFRAVSDVELSQLASFVRLIDAAR